MRTDTDTDQCFMAFNVIYVKNTYQFPTVCKDDVMISVL